MHVKQVGVGVGMGVYAARTTLGNCALLYADVCLFARSCAREGHNQLQMILTGCQRPRIAALVFLVNILEGPCLPSLTPLSCPSLLKTTSFFTC